MHGRVSVTDSNPLWQQSQWHSLLHTSSKATQVNVHLSPALARSLGRHWGVIVCHLDIAKLWQTMKTMACQPGNWRPPSSSTRLVNAEEWPPSRLDCPGAPQVHTRGLGPRADLTGLKRVGTRGARLAQELLKQQVKHGWQCAPGLEIEGGRAAGQVWKRGGWGLKHSHCPHSSILIHAPPPPVSFLQSQEQNRWRVPAHLLPEATAPASLVDEPAPWRTLLATDGGMAVLAVCH